MNIAQQTVIFGGAALGFMTASSANASCVCRCSGGENVPICTSTTEVPPICSPMVCPVVSPSVPPVQAPRVPPVGTQGCQMKQVLNPYTGQYEWKELCR